MTDLAAQNGGQMNIPLFRMSEYYYSKDCATINTAGIDFGPTVSLAPELMIAHDARRLKSSIGTLPPFPVGPVRQKLLRAALQLFQNEEIAVAPGEFQNFEDFSDLMWKWVGLPSVLIQSWSKQLSDLIDIQPNEPRSGLEVIVLPANTFLCLEAFINALLSAELVWMRPSRREPFAGARLIGCLLAVGWPRERIGFYPTDQSTLASLLRQADRATLFGGDAVLNAAYDETVTINGPGRAAAIVASDIEIDKAATWLTAAIANNAGRFCTSIGTILCESNVSQIGKNIAATLDAISLGNQIDEKFPQAVLKYGDANRMFNWLNDQLRDGDVILTKRQGVVESISGVSIAPIIIHVRDIIDHPLLGLELPFPAAIIAKTNSSVCRKIYDISKYIYLIEHPDSKSDAHLHEHLGIFVEKIELE